MTPEFLLVSFVVVASPGVGVLYTLAAGLSAGPRAAVIAAFGCTLGIVPHLAAALTGLAALLHASALAFDAIRTAGVVYLVYMAWRTLGERGALAVERAAEARSARRIVAEAVAANLLNPKLTLFFVAFLPQFVPAGAAAPLGSMLELSAVFMAMTFAVFAAYGIAAAGVRDAVAARPRILVWLRRAFAAAFVGLGLRLALAER